MTVANNIILNTDSYKASMFRQYPEHTSGVYSYIESRGGRYGQTLFFGLQGFLKAYFTQAITEADINEAEAFFSWHGVPFNKAGWQYIVDQHGGYLPIRIKAVEEGLLIPVKNVLLTIENTDPECFWLTTYLETALLRAIWYPSTVATVSWHIKKLIKNHLEQSGSPELIDFKLHDFGARGVSSQESAGIGGAAHLINFMGTDTISGILYAQTYYDAKQPGFSIPAAEHSTITAWGKDNEVLAYKNMLDQFAQSGKIVAIVSDSYDIFNAAEKLWGTALKQQVIDSGATVVIRPDSGDPVRVNTKLIEILGEKFGYTVNQKGYKVLNHVRIIQGDGVNELAISTILGQLSAFGWSADNIAFGMGGGLLQQLDRDTQKFAMKCSAACVNGEWIDVMKQPVTDLNKHSKAGRVSLFWDQQKQQFYSAEENGKASALQTVFENGELLNPLDFEKVRLNSKRFL
ncbi:MAG: nicotinate phosphoribosyltransferase [Methylococcaceae bacterium]|jgi:nicotinamide phosphoribosyltransferase